MRVLCIQTILAHQNPRGLSSFIKIGEVYHVIREGDFIRNVYNGKLLVTGPWYELEEDPGFGYEKTLFIPLGDEELSQDEVDEEVYQLVVASGKPYYLEKKLS